MVLSDMLNSKWDRQRGVSLIEVLVALFILSIVGVAILGGAYVNVKSTGASRENIRAEGLAKYELEYVKSVASENWSNITNQVYTIPSGNWPLWDPAHNGNDLPDTYNGYKVTITIGSLSGYNDNIRTLNAKVVNNKGTQEASIDTYVVNTQ
jgi:prepilin-type N-terminal cleavage/methylation domain-containing protein